MIVLVLGGGRSGKSCYAEKVARYLAPDPGKRYYLATGVAFDEEMQARINKHRQDRGERFVTVEEPIHLARAINEVAPKAQAVLVDCVTTWLGNLGYARSQGQFDNLKPGTLPDEADAFQAAWHTKQNPCLAYPPVAELVKQAPSLPCHLVMVSNELGLGLIPMEPDARTYRDQAGFLNQQLAAVADLVVFMVAGLPMAFKGSLLPLDK